eukprot:s123_g18.t1
MAAAAGRFMPFPRSLGLDLALAVPLVEDLVLPVPLLPLPLLLLLPLSPLLPLQRQLRMMPGRETAKSGRAGSFAVAFTVNSLSES